MDTTLLTWKTSNMRRLTFRKCLIEKGKEQALSRLFDSVSLHLLQASVLPS